MNNKNCRVVIWFGFFDFFFFGLCVSNVNSEEVYEYKKNY